MLQSYDNPLNLGADRGFERSLGLAAPCLAPAIFASFLTHRHLIK
jgi:hypothetical protein